MQPETGLDRKALARLEYELARRRRYRERLGRRGELGRAVVKVRLQRHRFGRQHEQAVPAQANDHVVRELFDIDRLDMMKKLRAVSRQRAHNLEVSEIGVVGVWALSRPQYDRTTNIAKCY